MYFCVLRRVRNTSGAGSTDTAAESQEENSNGVPAQAVSCPSTPAVGPVDTVSDDTPPSFKFLKTKRVSSDVMWDYL